MLNVKIEGGKDINIKGIIADLADIEDEIIIVHGANAARDKLAEDLGQPKKTLTSVSGYSSVFSDESAIDVMMMSYSGLRNKRIVELCQQHRINAVGLSGIDGRVVQGKRNVGIRIREGEKIKIVHDFSGKPKEVNISLLRILFHVKFPPSQAFHSIGKQFYQVLASRDIGLATYMGKEPKVYCPCTDCHSFLSDKFRR